MNLSRVSIHNHCFYVNGHQIEWPTCSEARNQYPDWGPHLHATKWLKWPWRSRGIWKCPSHSPSQSLARKPNTWSAWDLVLLGKSSDLHQRWESDITTTSHMVGANSGRHGLRWQIQPGRSCSDRPWQGHPVLWVAIIRRKIELGWGMRFCIHTVRSHWLGWQAGPT